MYMWRDSSVEYEQWYMYMWRDSSVEYEHWYMYMWRDRKSVDILYHVAKQNKLVISNMYIM